MPTKFTLTSLAIVTASIAVSLAPLTARAQAPGQTPALGQAPAQAQVPVQAPAQPQNAARAETPSGDISPAEELANLQAQIPILAAKAEIAKLKNQIENGGNASSGMSQGAPSPMAAWGANPMQAAAAQSTATSAAGASAAKSGMQAVSISGFDGRYQAVLTIDGRTVSVRPGDTIEGDWKVSSITESSVTLAHGKRVVVLRV